MYLVASLAFLLLDCVQQASGWPWFSSKRWYLFQLTEEIDRNFLLDENDPLLLGGAIETSTAIGIFEAINRRRKDSSGLTNSLFIEVLFLDHPKSFLSVWLDICVKPYQMHKGKIHKGSRMLPTLWGNFCNLSCDLWSEVAEMVLPQSHSQLRLFLFLQA